MLSRDTNLAQKEGKRLHHWLVQQIPFENINAKGATYPHPRDHATLHLQSIGGTTQYPNESLPLLIVATPWYGPLARTLYAIRWFFLISLHYQYYSTSNQSYAYIT